MELLNHPTIEFRPKDTFLAEVFRRAGNENLYLGVAGDTFEVFRRTGADTIVFSTKSAPLLWFFETYSQAKDLLVPVRMSIRSLGIAFLSLIKHTAKHRLQMVAIATLKTDRRRRTYFHFRVLSTKTSYSYPPAHLSPHADYIDLFTMLEKKNYRYVVLRWFEDPNGLTAGKDIDLLVDDEAVADIRAFTGRLPGTISIDLHSIKKLSRLHRNSMAYYPLPLASEILNKRVKYQNKFFVPDDTTYFKSLAYHGLYHKGSTAGIPSETKGVVVSESSKHNYVTTLQNLAAKAGFSGPMTMETLDTYLKNRGWQPPRDALRKISEDNNWVKKRFFSKPTVKQDVSLCVFVIRDKAIKDGHIDIIKRAIINGGFTILSERMLSPEGSSIKAAATRGGDWGASGYPNSGGGPGMVLATIDFLPQKLTERQKLKSPWLDNARTAYFKNRLREIINESIDEPERYSMLHSSDNHEEALEYLEVFFPEEKDAIVKRAEQMVREFRTEETVLADLTAVGRRAKVELIRHGDAKAVKKTFRPGYEKYLKKELEILKKFSGVRPEVPPILESGQNYFIVPFYESRWDFNKHKWYSSSSCLMPLWAVRQSLDFLKFLYEHNIYLPDAAPGNTIIDEKDGLKFIDFELYRFYTSGERPGRFEESYDIAGLPEKYHDPFGPGPKPRSYDRSWRPYTGLDLTSVLHDPAWKAHVKRGVFRLKKLARQLKINSQHVLKKTGKTINKLLESLVRNSTDIQ